MISPQTQPKDIEAVGFLVEVKRENISQYEYARVQADLQVRDRFHFNHENIILSELIGVI